MKQHKMTAIVHFVKKTGDFPVDIIREDKDREARAEAAPIGRKKSAEECIKEEARRRSMCDDKLRPLKKTEAYEDRLRWLELPFQDGCTYTNQGNDRSGCSQP